MKGIIGASGQLVLSNMASRVWIVGLQCLAIPAYQRLLGSEAYAVVGLSVSIAAAFLILESGLSMAIIRQIAQLSADPGRIQERADVVATLRRGYHLVGVATLLLMGLCAMPLAGHFAIGGVPHRDMILIFMLMGATLALVWPLAFHSGVLFGLCRHTTVNRIRTHGTTAQVGGGLLLMWWEPDLRWWFGWSLVVAVVQVLLLNAVVRNRIGEGCTRPAQVSWPAVQDIWYLSRAMLLVAVLSAVLMQADKWIVGATQEMPVFGAYTLCVSLATLVLVAASPASSAMLPLLSRAAGRGAEAGELAGLYAKTCQMIALLVVPAGIAMAVFAREITELVFDDPRVIEIGVTVLPFFALGNVLNGLMTPPALLQIARGEVRLLIAKNLIALILVVPALYWGTQHHGVVAPAIIWCGLNLAYVVCEIPLMHRLLAQDGIWRWYRGSLLVPVLVSAVVLVSVHAALGPGASPWVWLPVSTTAVLGVVLLLVALSAELRGMVRARLVHLGVGP